MPDVQTADIIPALVCFIREYRRLKSMTACVYIYSQVIPVSKENALKLLQLRTIYNQGQNNRDKRVNHQIM